MDFEKAKGVDFRFGKYKGQTIGAVGETDEGLLYLDWMIGQDWPNDYLKAALAAYLTDESISKEVDAALERKKTGSSKSGGGNKVTDHADLQRRINEYNEQKRKLRDEANASFGAEGGSDFDADEDTPF